MEPQLTIQKKKFRRKIMAAAALLVIFASVVFSMPSEQLAWQAPYVMGTLLLPKPSPGPYVRTESVKDNADSSFSLLAFISVVGILGLAIGKLPDITQFRRGRRLYPGSRFTIEDKITILYIL